MRDNDQTAIGVSENAAVKHEDTGVPMDGSAVDATTDDTAMTDGKQEMENETVPNTWQILQVLC